MQLSAQGSGLVIHEHGYSPDLPSLTVHFRDKKLVGGVVSKLDIKALGPLQVILDPDLMVDLDLDPCHPGGVIGR